MLVQVDDMLYLLCFLYVMRPGIFSLSETNPVLGDFLLAGDDGMGPGAF